MAIEEAITALTDRGMCTINGIKGIGLATTTTLQAPVTISGSVLIVGGIIVAVTPLAIMGTHYLIKRRRKVKGINTDKKFYSPNARMLMSLGVASTLMISVGTAMLPRTREVMIVHVIAGYTCIILSFVHVFQYRKIIKTQAKKFSAFLSAPKKTVPTKV